MTQLLQRFDTWAEAGSFRTIDFAIFRIAYALGILVVLPGVTVVAGRSDSFLAPPPGLFELLRTVPSETDLLVLKVLLMLAAASLCLGLFTTASSLAVCLLVMMTFGIDYSFGRIDHTILLVVAPGVMAFSGWGQRCSIDALRNGVTQDDPPQWPARLLAACIGATFLSAAIPKIQAGWLDPSSSAVQGYALRRGGVGNSSVVESLVDAVPSFAWEAIDVSTVALELLVLVTVLSWKYFRLSLAVLCLFHVGVVVFLDITFWQNVIVYAAFVSWSALPGRTRELGRWLLDDRRRLVPGSVVAVCGVVVASYGCRLGLASNGLDGLITMIGGVFGAIAVTMSLARRVT